MNLNLCFSSFLIRNNNTYLIRSFFMARHWSVHKLVENKENYINYLIKDIIYPSSIEDEQTAHYIYIKHVDRLFSLRNYIKDKDKRLCPIRVQIIPLCDFNKHICKCYSFASKNRLVPIYQKRVTLCNLRTGRTCSKDLISYMLTQNAL